MAGAEYFDAPEVEEVAQELIEQYHQHLKGARIKYLLRTGDWSSQKRETWGQAKRVTGEQAFLTNLDFIITIHHDVWEQLDEAGRKALLDHELCHCRLAEGTWYILGHDLEEFVAIVERHGLWRPQLEEFHEAVAGSQQQLPLLRRVEDRDGAPTYEANQAGIDAALDQVTRRTGTEG